MGNDGARSLGLEKAEIPLSLSIPSMVKVVSLIRDSTVDGILTLGSVD